MSPESPPLLNGRVSRELKPTAGAVKSDAEYLSTVKLFSDFFSVSYGVKDFSLSLILI